MSRRTTPLITRRTFGGFALAAAGGAAWADPAAPADVTFEIWRAGQKIGAHSVRFRLDGARRTATIAADFTVHVGPVPVFKHRHEATEVWEGPRFVSLVSRSVSNGIAETVNAKASADAVRIVHGGRTITAPADAAPLTHWNRDALKRPLFNAETGALLHPRIAQRGPETVHAADGRALPASAYALTGDTQITDWYDEAGAWAALSTRAPDGSTIEYRRA